MVNQWSIKCWWMTHWRWCQWENQSETESTCVGRTGQPKRVMHRGSSPPMLTIGSWLSSVVRQRVIIDDLLTTCSISLSGTVLFWGFLRVLVGVGFCIFFSFPNNCFPCPCVAALLLCCLGPCWVCSPGGANEIVTIKVTTGSLGWNFGESLKEGSVPRNLAWIVVGVLVLALLLELVLLCHCRGGVVLLSVSAYWVCVSFGS